MKERQYISEDSTVPVDGIDGQQSGWTQNDTSPSNPPDEVQITNILKQYFQAKNAVVIKERDELKKTLRQEREENERLSVENGKLRNIVADKDIKISDIEKELEQKQSIIDAYKNGNINSPDKVYDFVYDVTNFAPDTPTPLIESIFLKLLSLTQVKSGQDKWLIDCPTAVIPVFIMLTKGEKINKAYRYTGTLNSFCNEWNTNVAARIEDKERSQGLTCDYKSMKTQMGRAPYRGTSPAVWQRKLNEGKNVRILRKSVNVKAHMERLFA